MNIVLLIPNLFSGGAERQLSHLAQGLAGKSHKVHVVTFYHGGVFWDELSKDSRITLYCLYRKNKWDFFIAYKLLVYCRSNNIDLIQGFLEPSSVIASLAAGMLRIPLVIGVRSSNMVHAFGSRAYKLAERFLGNRLAKRYVFNSYAGKRHNSGLGYKQSIMAVIPNGLMIPERRFRKPFSDTCVYLGVVARLDPMKDLPTMLHAFALLRPEVGAVRLLIYGDGENSYKKKLQNLCANLNIEDYVVWKGWASIIWQAYDEIDILVSSSTGEGLSNTLMEGLAAARVVVATDVGDTRQLLEGEGGKMGYVVSSGSPERLAGALHYVIEHKDESLKCAQKARLNIECNYSVDAMVSAYDKLYKKILN